MRAFYISVLVLISFSSCSQKDKHNSEIQFKDFPNWWNYYSSEIQLSSNFHAVGSKENEISKKQFFDSLKTGNYLPMKSEIKPITYYLQKNKIVDESIRTTIMQVAEIHLFNLSWEGKKFPEFAFKDLSGEIFTSENTKDKTILIKTYFVNCQACNEEMPVLDKFISENTNSNLLFLSLALDDEIKLNNFLKNKNYKYQFVPNQGEFIKSKLHTNMFPTHFVVEKGKVIKVVNTAPELINFIKSK